MVCVCLSTDNFFFYIRLIKFLIFLYIPIDLHPKYTWRKANHKKAYPYGSLSLYCNWLIAVPSPPVHLTVRQLIGSRVEVLWDKPFTPNGVITHYTLYYSPPNPPIVKSIPANDTVTQSVIIKGYFTPNKNYTFWVSAQ